MNEWLKTGSLRRKCPSNTSSSQPAQSTFTPIASISAESSVLNENPATSRKQENTITSSTKKRKYDEDYLKIGFTCKEESQYPEPQCVICSEVLANSVMKPSLLRRHLETKHPQYVDKPIDFFVRKKKELDSSKKTMKTVLATNSEYLRASFLVAYKIAKTGKPYNIAEELILPAAKDMVSCVLGDKFSKLLDKIPLSNDTVARRIHEMAHDVEHQLAQRLQNNYYAIQVDESTDISGLPNLLGFIRYVYKNKCEEDFLFCKTLESTTKGEDIFNTINDFIEKHGIDWTKCVGISTDGAKAMTGRISGLISRIKNLAPEVKSVHCALHREALASKKIPDDLKTALSEVVKIINYIKARPLNSRLFALLCRDMGSEHVSLLLHCEVRWLSKGRILARFVELRHEIYIFLKDSDFNLKFRFEDETWLKRVTYLADIFSCLNETNASMQGSTCSVFTVHDKINALIKKIEFWKTCLRSNIFECFPLLHEFITTNALSVDSEMKAEIVLHLSQLSDELKRYFPDIDHAQDGWIRNPFAVTNGSIISSLTIKQQESLIEMSADETLQADFKTMSLIDFWAARQAEYSELSRKAVNFLLPFATTYLCESGFSHLVMIKTKYRNRLDAESELRLKLTKITPKIESLCDKKQAHPSH